MADMFETPGPVEADWKDAISPIEDIIDDARNGRMFVLVDHEDRENEGDLVIPAQMATPDAINFMATHGRGLICLTLPGSVWMPWPVADVDPQLLAPRNRIYHLHRSTRRGHDRHFCGRPRAHGVGRD